MNDFRPLALAAVARDRGPALQSRHEPDRPEVPGDARSGDDRDTAVTSSDGEPGNGVCARRTGEPPTCNSPTLRDATAGNIHRLPQRYGTPDLAPCLRFSSGDGMCLMDEDFGGDHATPGRVRLNLPGIHPDNRSYALDRTFEDPADRGETEVIGKSAGP